MASAGGLVASIPALKLLGHTYTIWELFLWSLSVAYFGVYFAVPMRRQMIEVDKLRFPSGTATAETIKAMFVDGEDTIKKSKSLFIFAVGTAVYSLFSYFIPFLEKPPMPPILVRWGWVLYFNPLLLGGGMLSGFRASGSLLIGAVLGWAIIGPVVQYYHWVSGDIMHFDGVRGWILWVGVAIMTADSLMTLIFSAKTIILGFWSLILGFHHFLTTLMKDGMKYFENDLTGKDDDGAIPNYWWITGLIFSTILLCFVGHFIFHIQFYFVLLSVPLSALLSVIATRCVGETDINPVGGMGKVTQLVYAGLAPHQITTNLLSAGIVAAGASQCGDLMGDLKTGHILKVHAKKQFITQCIGIVFGILVCIPIYKLFDTAYVIGGNEMPAPAAHAWKAVALILSEGLSHLPLHSPWGMLFGAILGIVLSASYRLIGYWREDVAQYIPSALAIGIGFIVPPKQALTMFIGSCGLMVWRRVAPLNAEFYYFTVSSGMVAGEGLMGIVIAVLKLLKIPPIFPE
jgi:OPT family oligopeptide transporter